MGFGKWLKKAFTPPKAIRKMQPLKAIGNAAKAVLPAVITAVPGIGAIAGAALGLLPKGVASAVQGGIDKAKSVLANLTGAFDKGKEAAQPQDPNAPKGPGSGALVWVAVAAGAFGLFKLLKRRRGRGVL